MKLLQYDRESKHIGERHLSEAELQRLKMWARRSRLLSIALTVLLPVVFLGCLSVCSALPERLPFVVLFGIGIMVGIPTVIIVIAGVSWERSRELYKECGCGIVQRFSVNSVTIERFSLSNRIWNIGGDLECLQPDEWHPKPSLYVWPDMLPGTTRKMTEAEQWEICRLWFQEMPVLVVLLGFGYVGVELIRFLAPYSAWGLAWKIGVFLLDTAILAIISQLFIAVILIFAELCRNFPLSIDLMHGRINQYYNRVSGKTVELLPISRRPWTVGGEPFYWRRKRRWT